MPLPTLSDSDDALLEAELRGLAFPVVLHLLSVCVGRLLGVTVEERVVAALSLRLLSTCSIVGLGFIIWLLERSIGCAGELYTNEGSTLAEVCDTEGCAAALLVLTAGAAEAGLECGCWTAKLFMAGVSKDMT